MKIELQRVDDQFNMEAKDAEGHSVLIDSSVANGGKGNGVRPMQMLLMGLGGCTAIDVVMILNKQRQRLDDFRIVIEADREQGQEPSLWSDVRIRFLMKGDVDPGKAQRAVELSMNKYCSVAETLRRAGAQIHYSVEFSA